MASFIRKIIDRSKSRSKSPVKYPINGSPPRQGERWYDSPPHHRQPPRRHPETVGYGKDRGEPYEDGHHHRFGCYPDTAYASPSRPRRHHYRQHTTQHYYHPPHFDALHSGFIDGGRDSPGVSTEARHQHHFQNLAPPREEPGTAHFLEEMAANEHQQRLTVPSPQPNLSTRSPPHHHHHLKQLIAPELFEPGSTYTTPIMKTTSARFDHAAVNNANSSNEYLTLNGTEHAWARHSHPGINAGPLTISGSGRRDVHRQEGVEAHEETAAVRKRSSSARPRSTSPRKAGLPIAISDVDERRHRSRSPYVPAADKRWPLRLSNLETIDYLHPQCKTEGCSAAIVVDDTRFLVCRHQLSHASEFFRTLFLNNRALPINGVRQLDANEYVVTVSGLRSPPPSKQFQWFLESTIPTPFLKDVADGTLETLMRLSRRFASRGLAHRCGKYIQESVESKPPLTALCWLNWAVKHRFDRTTHDKCMPVVARLSLADLEAHRLMMTESTLSDLLAMKLRACYLQTVKVFRTIHKMDHFVVTMEKCPACGRFKEQGKIRVLANPCNKMVGCERCMLEIGCEIERKSQDDYQADKAFYQCEHGLWAFGDRTEDCHCQAPLYNYRRGGSSVTGSDQQPIAPRNSLQVGCPATIPIVTTPTGASTKASGGAPPRVALQPADDLSDPASNN